MGLAEDIKAWMLRTIGMLSVEIFKLEQVDNTKAQRSLEESDLEGALGGRRAIICFGASGSSGSYSSIKSRRASRCQTERVLN